MKKIITICLIVTFSSCASVKIYKDKNNKNEVGLKFYQSKPFLLVEYNPSKDVNIKTSIIYLPDLSSPRYIRVKGGLGSANATAGFANGVITSYGAVSDSKIPETITSIASLTTSLVGLAGGGGEQAGDDEAKTKLWKKQAEKLDSIIGEKIDQGRDKRKAIGISKLGANPNLSSVKRKRIENKKQEVIDSLKKQYSYITVPSFAKSKDIIKNIKENAEIIKGLDLVEIKPLNNKDKEITKDQMFDKLIEIATALSEKEVKSVKSYFELFEINYDNGNNKYTFKKIDMPLNMNIDNNN